MTWMLPILFLYLFAGTFQYLGVISPTQCNFIVLFLFIHIFKFYSSWRQLRIEFLLFLFLIFIIVYHFIVDAKISYTSTYVYYLICTIIAACSGRIYANRLFGEYGTLSNTVFFKISKIFLFIQLLVTIIQASFTESYISFSKAAIGYEDAIFGTLFLQSDATLATICELMILSVYLLPSKYNEKIIITILGVFVVFLGNSKAAQLIILIILLILFFKFIFDKIKSYKLGFKILIWLFFILLFCFTYSEWSIYLYNFIQEAQYDYQRKDEWITAPRFAPFGEIFQTGISWFGQGPLTYYNPIEKTWLYNSGFSTIYVLYFDYGLLGFILYFAYQTFLILKFGVNFTAKMILFIILLSYMNFNLVLTDIGFIFMFNFTLLLLYRYKKLPIHCGR
ncbi:hypothetical protein [Acinetobacter sp. YH12142]|uniref:hypothetical protein n=1 Tax=Acinetobacter sp. YH12142 TaxID=2601126 RepID=UPI0015D406BA|nr:hypothetical protein [Acinetobacter sp. YH12142]